jgi:hypothetical protein
MSEIDFDTQIIRAEGFTTAPVQNELMMLNVEQGAYYSLDPIAAEIWNMLESPTSVNQIIKQLLLRYEVTLERCQEDVLAFLGEMHSNGMIQLK